MGATVFGFFHTPFMVLRISIHSYLTFLFLHIVL